MEKQHHIAEFLPAHKGKVFAIFREGKIVKLLFRQTFQSLRFAAVNRLNPIAESIIPINDGFQYPNG